MNVNRLAGLNAVCSFAASDGRCLRAVLEDSETVDVWLANLTASTELQGACLHSLAQAIDPYTLSDTHEQQLIPPAPPSATTIAGSALVPATVPSAISVSKNDGGEAGELGRRLLQAVGSSKRMVVSAYLLKLAGQPLDEVRHGAFDLMRAIAAQRGGWGLELLLKNPDFLPFFENRLTEYSKVGKEWKFSVIEAVWNSPQRALLSDEICNKIQKLIFQGPFYQPALQAELMTAER